MSDTNKIYVDLFSLFDMRQGILSTLCKDDDKLIEYLMSDEYNNREVDDFTSLGITKNRYDHAVRNITKQMLSNTTITYIMNNLSNKLSNNSKINASKATNFESELIVNIYPLELTLKEQNQLKNMLFISLGVKSLISIIYMNNKSIHPSYLDGNNISIAYIYDLSDWLNHHLEYIKDNTMTNCSIHSPTLSKLKRSDLDTEELKKLGDSDQFSYLELILSPRVRLVFVPVLYYTSYVISEPKIAKIIEELRKDNPLNDILTDEEKAKVAENVREQV